MTQNLINPNLSVPVLFGGTPPVTADFGLVNFGVLFDGASAGKFHGNVNGTIAAFNAPSGFAGNAIDIQSGGVSVFTADTNGQLTLASGLSFSGVEGTGSLLWKTGTPSLLANQVLQPYLQNSADPNRLQLIGLGSSGTYIQLVMYDNIGTQGSHDFLQFQTPTSGLMSGVRGDGVIYATGGGAAGTRGGIAHVTGTATPTDALWTTAPPIGTEFVDTTNSKVWWRTAAGTWKGVAIA